MDFQNISVDNGDNGDSFDTSIQVIDTHSIQVIDTHDVVGFDELGLNEFPAIPNLSRISPTLAPTPTPTLTPAQEGLSMQPVNFGDYIFLSSSSGSFFGYVSADSCFERVGFQTSPPSTTPLDFSRNLFQIVPFLSYDSKAARGKLKRNKSFSMDEQKLVEMRIAIESVKNEKQIAEMQSVQGSIIYGQVLQLRHCNTGKFLNAESYTANMEKDCLLLSLSEGSSSCHFKIFPRYKVRNEGSEVLYGDQIQFLSVQEIGYGIHVSNNVPYDPEEPAPHITELNLSTNPSSVKIQKYCKASEEMEKTLHFHFDLIRLFHPETESFLVASCNTNKAKKGGKPYYRRIEKEDETGASTSNVADSTKESNVSGKQIWKVEHLSRLVSGPVMWDSPIRIRHGATNMYLAVDYEAKAKLKGGGLGEESYRCRLVDGGMEELSESR